MVAHWVRAAREALLGEMPMLAGGTALFAVFAVVPAIAATVAIYGVVADPSHISSHLDGLDKVLPPNVVVFLGEQLERQTRRSSRDIGLALAVSVVVAVWSARGAARALIDALNRAYRVRERRRPLHKLLITIAMAATTLLGLIVMLSVIVALPAVFALLHIDDHGIGLWLRWPVLMAVMLCALMLLYRYAPSPRDLTERHLWPGALTSTLLLVLMSWALSLYVESVANYDLWYGTFGSVVVVLLWFYLSTFSIVLGGFVNAELERHSGAPAPDRSMY
ncbi:MAG: putative ribonuclease [Deltaproteobacteria bacterium]|nr:putative ribonuclease [Deltaproteobacteria bacterium]